MSKFPTDETPDPNNSFAAKIPHDVHILNVHILIIAVAATIIITIMIMLITLIMMRKNNSAAQFPLKKF